MKESCNLKSGDVVVLPSGSPLMTVERVVGGSVECVWFHSRVASLPTNRGSEFVEEWLSEPLRSSFPAEALERV
jgi:uncharacterized protein YodC (DUF2158 family)